MRLACALLLAAGGPGGQIGVQVKLNLGVREDCASQVPALGHHSAILGQRLQNVADPLAHRGLRRHPGSVLAYFRSPQPLGDFPAIHDQMKALGV